MIDGLDDFGLRLNQPLIAERVFAEKLYSQARKADLAPSIVPMELIAGENDPCCLEQAWCARLTVQEAVAVASFTRGECRWIDLDVVDNPRTVSELGSEQIGLVKGLESALRSAVSKSMTYGLVVRHYLRRMPSPRIHGSTLKGEVFVIGNYLSCALADRSGPGYGMVELRIAVPPGAAKGVFVSPPDASVMDAEFLLLPGTTIRIVATARNTVFAECIRPLASVRFPEAVRPYGTMPVAERTVCAYNGALLRDAGTSDQSGKLPPISPPRTEGWGLEKEPARGPAMSFRPCPCWRGRRRFH